MEERALFRSITPLFAAAMAIFVFAEADAWRRELVQARRGGHLPARTVRGRWRL